ncbi:hypothetical protein L4174_023885 (plasmid) [Photobacterium sp. CCB-ST2H9]|uniref:hypothetical protein n=1 Tax=Photobacterium sp. CCB-ST2H9 TaxID=2912855 RepID=UPI002004E8B8|nr:hypothetical protein [Photobacterium sp. CCB-ST2H9]UTM60428.1 hypothetical protein L4174_023885 [Photobacterium sp. CCB-ST2H9]
MSSNKRIYILSLSREVPAALTAGFVDGILHIVNFELLPSDIKTLKKDLPEKLETLRQNGFIVVVDELLNMFSHFGRCVRLSNVGPDGRPILVTTLDAYRTMQALKAITYPKSGSGFYEIPDSIVEPIRDGKGEVSYNIDWSQLTVESSCLLLAIHAAVHDSLLDRTTAEGLLGSISGNSREQKRNPLHAFTHGYDAKFLSPDALEK